MQMRKTNGFQNHYTSLQLMVMYTPHLTQVFILFSLMHGITSVLTNSIAINLIFPLKQKSIYLTITLEHTHPFFVETEVQ